MIDPSVVVLGSTLGESTAASRDYIVFCVSVSDAGFSRSLLLLLPRLTQHVNQNELIM